MIRKNGLIQLVLIFMLSCIATPVFSDRETKPTSLYVFYPSDITPYSLQRKIASVCSNIDIKVYKIAKDFFRAVKKNVPTSIISINPKSNHSGYTTILQGKRKGKSKEPYILVSRTIINVDDMDGKVVGVVDFLGTVLKNDFLQKTLNAEVKVKRLRENNDIIPTLLFNSADMVFISKFNFERLRSQTKSTFIASEKKYYLNLVSVSILDEENKINIKNCINSFDSEINHLMGVDSWK